MNKELALKLMEEGDDEAELASRKKKGKVAHVVLFTNLYGWFWPYTSLISHYSSLPPPPSPPCLYLQAVPSILGDDRFKVMFENPDYQVDEQSEEFRLLNPIVSKVGQKRKKKLQLLAQQAVASQQVLPMSLSARTFFFSNGKFKYHTFQLSTITLPIVMCL